MGNETSYKKKKFCFIYINIVLFKMTSFKRVSEKERRNAVDSNNVDDIFLYYNLQYNPNKTFNDGHWDNIPLPDVSDWLSDFTEYPISFFQYKRKTPKVKERSNILYLQPFGEFEPKLSPDINIIKEYAEIFFQMETKVNHPFQIRYKSKKKAKVGNFLVPYRMNDFGEQLLTKKLIKILKQNKPADGHCIMGLTMTDLYPQESWNFVFGEAMYNTGVFSFIRYSPEIEYEDEIDELSVDDMVVLLRRSCNVMTHEVGHMMGISHCVYFNCVMNGANSLEESDNQSSHLCPVCLRKLQHHIGFDTKKRYKELYEFYIKYGLIKEAEWIKKRLTIVKKKLKKADD